MAQSKHLFIRFFRPETHAGAGNGASKKRVGMLALVLLCYYPASVWAGFDHFYVEPQLSSDRVNMNSGHYKMVATGLKAGFYMTNQIPWVR